MPFTLLMLSLIAPRRASMRAMTCAASAQITTRRRWSRTEALVVAPTFGGVELSLQRPVTRRRDGGLCPVALKR